MSLFDYFSKESKRGQDSPTGKHSREAWKLTVFGTVQGVGFRWSVQTLAQDMHLKGTVKNNPDSTVTIILQASKKEVDRFMDRLPNHISQFAHIRHIVPKYMGEVEQMHGFHVVY